MDEAQINALSKQGWIVIDDFTDPELSYALLQECRSLLQEGHLHQATIGREQNNQLAPEIRRSSLWWWPDKPTSSAQIEFWRRLDLLRLQLKRLILLPLDEIEVHFGHYPIGGYYHRHRDQFDDSAFIRPSSRRNISFILYLDSEWRRSEGGALLIYNEKNSELLDQQVWPQQGRLAVFLSETIEHEVAITHRERHTITGWIRSPAFPAS